MEKNSPLSAMQIGEIFQCSTCFVDITLTITKQRNRNRKCPPCRTIIIKKNQSKNPIESRERARVATRIYHHKNKERINLETRMRRKLYPEKDKARRKTRTAISNGTLKRLPCRVCGNVKSQGHHKDYSNSLDVVWLCPMHHKQHHVNESATAYWKGKK